MTYQQAQQTQQARPHGGGKWFEQAWTLAVPGEQVYGAADGDLSDLIRRVPRRYRRPDMRLGSERALDAVVGLLDLLDTLGDLFESVSWGLVRSLRRLLRGRALRGGWQSLAGRFVITVRSAAADHRNDDVVLVSTDRRLLVATHVRGRLVPLGELAHPQLRRVKVRHTWISDRVDLHFEDGSVAALEVNRENLPALPVRP
ncbi:hypothetical protein [Kitasatospora sp. NPDC088134]|uniref:hypothetical protein n=1 Tax=Kitasatospora sp. NPDC088134 TaxID=3364071 RepID=UPI00382E78DB